MLDPNLLNKIQSIKTLRDRAGTEGEKDAAQNRLVIILAKHKLTEQDIPAPDFSTRDRYTPPPRKRPERTQAQQSAEQAFSETFDRTMRDFEDAIRFAQGEGRRSHRGRRPPKQRPPYTQPPPPPRKETGSSEWPVYRIETSAKVRWKGNLLWSMAKACGFQPSKSPYQGQNRIAWELTCPATFSHLFENLVAKLKRHCKLALTVHHPSNPASFRRAFYEAATYEIAARLRGGVTQIPHYKSREIKGLEEGRTVGLMVSLAPWG